MLVKRLVYFRQAAAGTHADGEIARIVVLNAIQPASVQQDVNPRRNIADGLLRESAAGHNHKIFFRCQGNHRGHLARRSRRHCDLWRSFVNGELRQRFGIFRDVFSAANGRQFARNRRCRHGSVHAGGPIRAA